MGNRMSKDTIYRQDAIDVADKIIDRDTSGNNDVVKAMTAWKEFIKGLPSAEPEPHWIPCTPETMPEDEYVLISKKPTKISGSKWNVAIAIRTADPRSRKIQWRDSGFGVIPDDNVLAWMPLPEPYQPKEES